MNPIRQELQDAIEASLTEEALAGLMKKARDIADSMVENVEYGIKSDMAYNLASYVERMATDAIEAILKGNEDQMRRYLSCEHGGYTGRDRGHPVIHGKLFECGAIELRKSIVEAHAELLKNERIMDLEDQVKSLVSQINQEKARLEDAFLKGHA